MALDSRKIKILSHIKNNYFNTSFCAKDITDTFGEQVAGTTLSALAKAGFLKKDLNQTKRSPVYYQFVTLNEKEAMDNMEGIFKDASIINTWPLWENFKAKNYFNHIGQIKVNIEKEEMIWCPNTEDSDIEEGLVYFFVIDGHIYKDGKTDSLMKERIQSYNCGKDSNRQAGTCSVTNFKVLHTLLNFNRTVDVYVYRSPYVEVSCFGKTFLTKDSPAKAIEKETNRLLIEQFGELMPGCFQS